VRRDGRCRLYRLHHGRRCGDERDDLVLRGLRDPRMSDRQQGRRWASAVLTLCAALVMISGQVVPGLRQVPAAVWGTAALLLGAALVAALRQRPR
jgi:hypothetical protein